MIERLKAREGDFFPHRNVPYEAAFPCLSKCRKLVDTILQKKCPRTLLGYVGEVRTLTSGWSGATPNRTNPNGTGSRSTMSTCESACRWNSIDVTTGPQPTRGSGTSINAYLYQLMGSVEPRRTTPNHTHAERGSCWRTGAEVLDKDVPRNS